MATRKASSLKVDSSEQLTQHFSKAELRCSCGCGKAEVTQLLASGLEGVRLILGVPLRITSGYRCPAHNAAVGGAKGSKHVLGLAADVTCEKGVRAIYDAALRIPAFAQGGIGVSPGGNFVHLDVRPNGPARWGYIGHKTVALADVLKDA